MDYLKEQHMTELKLFKISKIIICIFFFAFQSCKNDSEVDFYKRFVSKGEYIASNQSATLFVLSKSDDKKVFLLDLDDLDYIYNKEYSNQMSLESFLNETLNQKMPLSINEKDFPSFDIDKSIEADFQHLDKEVFLNKYTIKSAHKNKFIVNAKKGDKENKNIAYCLFKSGFIIFFDDYSGFYYATLW